MNEPRLLNRKPGLGLRAVMSVITGVVVATIGAAPAYALPDRANVTSEFSHKVSAKPDGVAIAPAPQPPGCDLSIGKTMSPTPLVSGQPITVTLTVTNVGTGTCPTGILNNSTVLSDNKQPGLTFTGPPVANPAAGWACSLSGGNATCAHPIPIGLPPGYTVTFTIPAVITAPGGTGLANCAEIANKKDTNTANNRACALVIVEHAKCDLEITKTMSPTPLVSGQPATVTLTVVNRGNGACRTGILNDSTVLSDNKQPGLTFTGPPVANPAGGWACSLSGGNATCAHPIPIGLPPGGFPPGYTATFTIPATVTATPSAIVTNCAEITNKYDTNPANNRSCVTKRVALLPSTPG